MAKSRKSARRDAFMAGRQARQRRLMQVMLAVFSVLLVLSMVLSLVN